MIALAVAGCARDPEPGATTDGGAPGDAAAPHSDGAAATDAGPTPDGNIAADAAVVADAAPASDGSIVADAAPAPDGNIVADAAPAPDGGILPEVFRIALEVSNDVPESIYVQLNGDDGQPGWVVVRRGEDRMWFEARCEIEDCEEPSGVCGAALPRVRDITGGTRTGSIELFWDGVTSVRDPERGCERRVPAPPGDYVATFCWSLRAEFEGAGDPEEAIGGRVVDPTCVDVPFTFPDDEEVVHRILGG